MYTHLWLILAAIKAPPLWTRQSGLSNYFVSLINNMEKAAVSDDQEQSGSSGNDQGTVYMYKGGSDAVHAKHRKGGQWWRWIKRHLNFFRIFILVFVFFPLMVSIIFWAVSTEYKVAYVDALYLCYSSFTSTGTTSSIEPFRSNN